MMFYHFRSFIFSLALWSAAGSSKNGKKKGQEVSATLTCSEIEEIWQTKYQEERDLRDYADSLSRPLQLSSGKKKKYNNKGGKKGDTDPMEYLCEQAIDQYDSLAEEAEYLTKMMEKLECEAPAALKSSCTPPPDWTVTRPFTNSYSSNTCCSNNLDCQRAPHHRGGEASCCIFWLFGQNACASRIGELTFCVPPRCEVADPSVSYREFQFPLGTCCKSFSDCQKLPRNSGPQDCAICSADGGCTRPSGGVSNFC